MLAGDWSFLPELRDKAPNNAKFVGYLNRGEIAKFYRKACFLVLPSKWFEVFPLVLLEAMSYGLPVIASGIGGLPVMVENSVTGLLFETGNAEDQAKKIKLLWEHPDLCRQMGMAGREKAIREYNEDVYYRWLMALYETAIEMTNKQKLHRCHRN